MSLNKKMMRKKKVSPLSVSLNTGYVMYEAPDTKKATTGTIPKENA